ncbi:phosphate ABC transporter permease subunit PstC [Methanosarcinales archaeon]|nr:MAG: phosphate ABC transporter permease subunit PstC [Methanosarcinales archaeon]
MTSQAKVKENLIHSLFFFCSVLSIFIMLGIVVVIVTESIAFFREVSIWEFITDTQWTPLFTEKHFGILPLLNGTLLVAFGSALVSIPTGSLIAIYLSEYASPRVKGIIKPVLEVLAGIPTVVYGYFALTFITPVILKHIFTDVMTFNAASASIVVGIMTLPMVASVSEDALSNVPQSLREGAYALGARKIHVVIGIVYRAALSGVFASYILALSRAIGETMAVTIAAGATPRLTLNFFESIQTMTAYIVQVSLGDTPFGTIEYKTIFAVALVLFIITLSMNILSNLISGRYRRMYQ